MRELTSPAIAVRGLCKSDAGVESVLALETIDFTVADGEFRAREIHRLGAILLQNIVARAPTGKDEATALKDDVKTLEARIANFKLAKAGVKRWGESSQENYQAYLDFLLKLGVIKQPVKAGDVTTNALIDEANQFDIAAVQAAAKAYK